MLTTTMSFAIITIEAADLINNHNIISIIIIVILDIDCVLLNNYIFIVMYIIYILVMEYNIVDTGY